MSTENDCEIRFEEGLIGLPEARRFHLLAEPGSPVRLLQSLDVPRLRLPVVDPFDVDPDYRPALDRRVRTSLAVESGDKLLLLAIAVLQPDGTAQANLRAPLVINAARRCGVQAVVEGGGYSTRAPVTLENVTVKQDASPPREDRRSHAGLESTSR